MVNPVIILISFILLLAFVGVLLIGGFAGGNRPVGKPQCSDTRDNDGDGLIDKDDPGCLNATGSYEPNIDNEYADEENKNTICKSNNDCSTSPYGRKCIMIYPGNFIPFCGCITNTDCASGICGTNNKCS